MEQALFNHLALPQCLPQHEDAKINEVEARLVDHITAAARLMRGIGENREEHLDAGNAWESIVRCLHASKTIHDRQRVNRTRLLSELRSMTATDVLVVHVHSQNAAVMIHRLVGSSDQIIFEVFEASPRNEDVLAADNALQWDFPGSAVAIPLATFNNDDFQLSLATFLEQASLESTKAFAAHTFKAGAEIFEYRDTPNPTMISSMLMAILEENGHRISVPLLRKRVRDDICWSRASRPWRRLPHWLVLRVVISRFLSLALGGELGRFEYKFFLSICLGTLLESAQPSLAVDQVDFLRTKLSRRLVKLDVDRSKARDRGHDFQRVDHLFEKVTPRINAVIRTTIHRVQTAWESFKNATKRTIPALNKMALVSELKLPLRVSGQILEGMQATLNRRMMGPRHPRWTPPPRFDFSSVINEDFTKYARPFFNISKQEHQMRNFADLQADLPENTVTILSRKVRQYLNKALPLYEGNPGQMSLLILNAMELWTRLDAVICMDHPLLQEYHPVFTPDILDLLHLADYGDMVRLHKVQSYLWARIKASHASRMNVFDDPSEWCFAVRYYDECPDADPMHAMHEDIEQHARMAKESKLEEWQRKTEQFETLTKRVNESTCIYVADEFDPLGRGLHDERACPRCQMMWRLNRMSIQIYEHPLPSDEAMAKTAIFELMCPPDFSLYRDTTWMLLFRLGSSPRVPGVEPKCLLRDYAQLSDFVQSSNSTFTLASVTKSFLKTHYANVQFPVDWQGGRDGVCRPNGLKLGYFDMASQTWPGRAPFRPSFAHHLRIQLPLKSPFQSLLSNKNFAVENNSPTSYEIMASQMNCPVGVNPHEFVAFQTLVSGSAGRWLSVLMELASANLNFSSETTMVLLNHLALQCGPKSDQNDPMRLVHGVFRQRDFVEKLVDQLDSRLSSLSANWREIHLMGMIITFALRIYNLASAAHLAPVMIAKASATIVQAREICIGWVRILRDEVQTTQDTVVAQRLQKHSLAAAVLCRRTFVIHVDQTGHLDPLSLAIYIESTTAFHDNIPSNIQSLPRTMLHDLIHVLKLSQVLHPLISTSICDNREGFGEGLKYFWPDAQRVTSATSTLDIDPDGWVRCELAETKLENHQVVHWNLLLGTLLVNGKPVGKLPQDSQNSVVVQELFGNQPLRVYQSRVPGMTYTLARCQNRFTVHFGYENGQTVIVAKPPGGHMLRLVGRHHFYDEQGSDLPYPLIKEQAHWLNLDSGDVYIRPLASAWNLGPGTWIINARTKTCRRLLHDRDRSHENVVDPNSVFFQRITKILDGLCDKHELLIVQPSNPAKPRKAVEVRIQRLQLMFFVNFNRLLYSPQLRLEVDPNQDAGTWYGLHSKLVCRKPSHIAHRVILVPLGRPIAKRLGCHVQVKIAPDEKYGKFFINDTLGRIECAAEPLLLSTKALLHAYTSFPIADPLTGRTGTEESLHFLKSGVCHPWAAIGALLPQFQMSRIAALTPARVYYPSDLKTMKTDRWDKNLTTYMQHPLFLPLIEDILKVSNELGAFKVVGHPENEHVHDVEAIGDVHLNERALVRRQLYERRTTGDNAVPENTNRLYLSRDKSSNTDSHYAKVLRVVNLLRVSPDKFNTPKNLPAILSQGNIIGGYGCAYDKISLSDRMHTDIRESWGSLVEFCRDNKSRRYSLMFLFAALSFRQNVDDDLLRALVAFSILSDLEPLPLPRWPSYFNFRPQAMPQLDSVAMFIQRFRTPVPKIAGEDLAGFASAKQLRKMKGDRNAHELKSEEDCRYLAKFLLDQWPCREPSVSGLNRPLLVNIEAALDVVRPEWLRFYQNMELSVHLDQVQQILDQRHLDYERTVPAWIPRPEEVFSVRPRGDEVPSLDLELLLNSYISDPLFSGFNWEKSTNLQKAGSSNPSQPEWAPLSGPMSLIDAGLKAYRMDPKATTNIARQQHRSSDDTKKHTDELRQIVNEVAKSKSLVRKTYANDLLQSILAYEKLRLPQGVGRSFIILRSCDVTKSEVIRTFRALKRSLDQPTCTMPARRIEWLKLGGLWPNMTTVVLLEFLRSTASPGFGKGMRDGLISFALAITRYQRDLRLNECVLANDTSRFQDEEANIGHRNWRPSEHPDWLLLEVESNLLIRPDQVDVARATIWPESGANSVLQMNMGQGKTSCIIPMVAATMANKKNLVRIIVPKALLQQTAQLLQSRLGGMLGRHVRHIPFSRQTVTTKENIQLYFNIHKHVLKTAGVMLCLPEHNLSFMLSGQQRLLDGNAAEGAPMVKVQAWLRSVCRDILDESDYQLAVRTQLIYPSGTQALVDGNPHRWQVIETILGLVDRHLYGLAHSFPKSIKVVRRPGGGFPLIYFLRQDAEDEMLARLTVDITKGFGDILPMQSLAVRDRTAIKDFLTPNTQKLRSDTLERIRKLCSDQPRVRQTVYLLRGLLVNRILVMTLKKRWNVQYGLHPTRSPVAVPYIAKGVASDQSEWGHPDVAILFTCLAFYYDGISISQLKEALLRVLKSDDPSTEYDKWTQGCGGFPESLKAWNTINVDDDVQVQEIWNAVRYQIVVIDYYLNNFVFPRHAKQFKVKLQSNGWDIPLFLASDADADPKKGLKPLTTGFSGTNDSRTMLPLTIKQQDLSTLSHTNAEVLTYLLREPSRRCEVIAGINGGRATEREFLLMMKKMNIRILIDAGAQILEMDNETLAKTWLSIDSQHDAALYFDSANKPWVVSKKSRKTPLLASPYADDLSKCLVYLDEAHTRGTDLKFPLNARGALTLGQGQSKDHTVQAAMRMRQLGTSQSIVFFVPPEVHQVIADLRGKQMDEKLNSYDVICWLLDNACTDIEMLQPLYFSQGTDFCRRTQAAIDHPEYLTNPDHRAEYVSSIRQNELQTLKDMYEPKTRIKASGLKSSHPKVAAFLEELIRRRKGFQDTGRAVHGSALQEVEQEREDQLEVECIRQVKRPVHYEALTFPGLHRDLETFARTGRLPVDSYALFHVFHVLSKTALGRKHSVSRSVKNQSRLFVSAEFERTARFHRDLLTKDNFMRPVSWVLWSGVSGAAVVLIPEEADLVIRMMRAEETHPQTYLITYASPVTRKMLSFNNLTFYSLPSLPKDWVAPQWLKTELGILSGRLYFEWEEHEALCEFLDVNGSSSPGLHLEEEEDSEEEQDVVTFDGGCEKPAASSNGHLNSYGNGNIKKAVNDRFSPRPLTFLQEWLAVRRHGQDFVHTPMGFLTQGKPLHTNHPFFGGLGTESPGAKNGGAGEGHMTRIVSSAGVARGRLGEHYPGMGEGDGDGDVFDAIDDMGANVGDDGSDDEDEEALNCDDSDHESYSD